MIEVDTYAAQRIANQYKSVVKGMDARARKVEESGERSYGGFLRAKKGEVVERLAADMVLEGWKAIGGDPLDFDIDRAKIRVPVREDYVRALEDEEVRQHILDNVEDFYYDISVDRHVKIRGELAMVIECKAYAENAMFKRILYDFDLIAQHAPDHLVFVLFQLESQLGGDYSDLRKVTLGSSSTHTLLSHFDNKVEIMTLLRGERKVNRPIHKDEYYKPLEYEVVKRHIRRFAELLMPHI